MFKYDRRKFGREIKYIKDWEFAVGQNKHANALAQVGAEVMLREIMGELCEGAQFWPRGKNRDDLVMSLWIFDEFQVHVNLRQELIGQMDLDPEWDDHEAIIAALEKIIRAVKRRHKRNEQI